MNSQRPFIVYNASAGSGKTFTLVKEYLKKVLSARGDSGYKNLLALTFTNKAVAEMKQRIVDNLVDFSLPEVVENTPPMLAAIARETESTVTELHEKSKRVLKNLLHQYARFSVETIDRFNHTLIRTFARDLNLSSTFEVSLDTELLLAEAVDQLISRAGENQEITKVLLDFVIEKTDDDRSWDISRDIAHAAQLLFDENERFHVKKLENKSLSDFNEFAKTLRKKVSDTESQIKTEAAKVIDLIHENGLDEKSFSGGYLYKHFSKLMAGDMNVSFSSKWQGQIAEKPLYTVKTRKENPDIANWIDAMASFLNDSFHHIKLLVFEHKLVVSALKNLIPLSVINLVQKEIERIKEEKNILPISEFNALINSTIKNEPAPFIYERLGERYRHFFIDEFQDTSLLQWENLVPLIDNSLAQLDENQEQGSLLIVGDAKQSIYRWRGGLPEQFIDLYHQKNPFSVTSHVENLPKNYRSFREIVAFNNSFFQFIAQYFGNPTHADLFTAGNKQEDNAEENGYIEISFLETKDAPSPSDRYAEKVLKTIQNARENRFDYADICILTRRKSEGVFLSEYLMQQGIPVVSQETLLLQASSTVKCLVSALRLSVYPEDEVEKVNVLGFLYDHLDITIDKHDFFLTFLNDKSDHFDATLQQFDIDFHFKDIKELSIYESLEYIIRKFKFAEKADAYLYSFLDFVFDFEQKPQSDKLSFLDHWESKKDKAAVATSEGLNAVKLMTIHKAKGLEFPVVIFPFATTKIYNEIDAKAWFPINADEFGFDEAFINYNKDVAEFGVIGQEMYAQRQQTLELDALNLLYVTLTRPVEQLYIVTEVPSEIRDEQPVNFSQLFKAYLDHKNRWEEGKHEYSFGKNEPKSSKQKQVDFPQLVPKYISNSPESHNLQIVSREALLWDTEAAMAIEEGNVLHDTMALIKTKKEADHVLTAIKERNILTEEKGKGLTNNVNNILNHPELAHLFAETDTVYNEREIITAEGFLLRPDRLNIHSDQTVTILDYKTGVPKESHLGQINTYAQAMQEMGLAIHAKLLVYIQDQTIVVNKL